MKTYKNLYPQICAFENLFLAFCAAARGKRGRPEVAAFERELEPNLFLLQEELLAQTYRPGPYTHFPIRDPKPRIISAADFRDRVVHHALVRVIEPIFERRFIHDSYACRKGKGTHKGIDRCQEYARHYTYVLQCDLVHFFPSILTTSTTTTDFAWSSMAREYAQRRAGKPRRPRGYPPDAGRRPKQKRASLARPRSRRALPVRPNSRGAVSAPTPRALQ